MVFMILIKILFLFFSLLFMCVGFLMLVVPKKYPAFYAGFVRESVLRRESTERGRELTIRLQGLKALASGAFVGLFLWFLWDLPW